MERKKILGRPSESWLRSEDHDKFAAAAVKCLNGAGTCMQDGYCAFGGCFGVKNNGNVKAADIYDRVDGLEKKWIKY